MSPEGQEDRDYWNDKYAEASCHDHGSEEMWYDEEDCDWVCGACIWEQSQYGGRPFASPDDRQAFLNENSNETPLRGNASE